MLGALSVSGGSLSLVCLLQGPGEGVALKSHLGGHEEGQVTTAGSQAMSQRLF